MDETLVCIFGATLLLLLSAAIVANYEEIWDFFYSFFHDLSRLIKQRQVGQTTKSSPSPMHPISSPQLTSEQLAELRLQHRCGCRRSPARLPHCEARGSDGTGFMRLSCQGRHPSGDDGFLKHRRLALLFPV